MKHNAIVLEVRQTPIFFSPRKSAIPRQVPITRWQTHSWTKKISKLRKHPDTGQDTQTMRQRGK